MITNKYLRVGNRTQVDQRQRLTCFANRGIFVENSN